MACKRSPGCPKAAGHQGACKKGTVASSLASRFKDSEALQPWMHFQADIVEKAWTLDADGEEILKPEFQEFYNLLSGQNAGKDASYSVTELQRQKSEADQTFTNSLNPINLFNNDAMIEQFSESDKQKLKDLISKSIDHLQKLFPTASKRLFAAADVAKVLRCYNKKLIANIKVEAAVPFVRDVKTRKIKRRLEDLHDDLCLAENTLSNLPKKARFENQRMKLQDDISIYKKKEIVLRQKMKSAVAGMSSVMNKRPIIRQNTTAQVDTLLTPQSSSSHTEIVNDLATKYNERSNDTLKGINLRNDAMDSNNYNEF